jgi:hypothetical protein
LLLDRRQLLDRSAVDGLRLHDGLNDDNALRGTLRESRRAFLP